MPLQCTRHQFLLILEKMLCFNALYRSLYNFVGKSWNEKQEFQMNVRKMMMMIKVFIPRSEGNGWKLQKFHELLHLVLHIDDYGSPLNFDAGTGERGLKEWVKKFARTVQFQGQHTYSTQIATRVHESAIIQKATIFQTTMEQCLFRSQLRWNKVDYVLI